MRREASKHEVAGLTWDQVKARLQGGAAAIDHFFARRRSKLAEQYAPRLAGRPRAEQVAALAEILT